jgi:hypothetical protein
MSDYIRLANKTTALDTAPAFSPFTGVKLWCDDTNFVFSGDDTGRVLEADLPWATQEIADSVLASIRGFEYQPFSAQNALLDPAAELGDGVSVGGVYGVLAACDTNFNAMCASNISAPSDEEIDHEYHYTTPEKRMERRVSKMTSELRVMSDSITGLVEDVEGNRAEFEQTAEALTARVESAEGAATEAQQTAEGFSQRITDAEGNISSIEHTLDGVVYTTGSGTTVIDGSHITTGTIDADKVTIENLTVENGDITSLDVGKLTVNGAAISASNPWTNAYHTDVYVSQRLSSGSGGNLYLQTISDGYTLITAAGVTSVYGTNPAGYVSWNKIIETIQSGGTGTAVFG